MKGRIGCSENVLIQMFQGVSSKIGCEMEIKYVFFFFLSLPLAYSLDLGIRGLFHDTLYVMFSVLPWHLEHVEHIEKLARTIYLST